LYYGERRRHVRAHAIAIAPSRGRSVSIAKRQAVGPLALTLLFGPMTIRAVRGPRLLSRYNDPSARNL
jgi:hypothetical protein